MNIIFLYITLLTGLISDTPPELTINISDIESVKGNIVVGVFDREKNFLKDGAAVKNYTLTVKKSTEKLVIRDLPKGDYAISLYHDENSNNKCDRNFLGIPKEAYGFSNNIKPKLGPPSFKDCKFSLENDMIMEITLVN